MDIASATKEVSLSNTLEKFLSGDRSNHDSNLRSSSPDSIGPYAKESSGHEDERVRQP